MLTDLRVINKTIQSMGSLHHGIPLPSLLPKVWPIIVNDLEDCFPIIPLQKQARESFSSTVPMFNPSMLTKLPLESLATRNVE